MWFFPFINLGSDLNSHDTCSEQFSGESPFSEIESFNVATYLTDRRSDLIAFFDFHSYGQLWMSPWGWREDRPSDYDEMVSKKDGYLCLISVHIFSWNGYNSSLGFPMFGDSLRDDDEALVLIPDGDEGKGWKLSI